MIITTPEAVPMTILVMSVDVGCGSAGQKMEKKKSNLNYGYQKNV